MAQFNEVTEDKLKSSKYIYNTRDNVIFDISRNVIDGADSIELTDADIKANSIKITYDNGDERYINLESLIQKGDKFGDNNLVIPLNPTDGNNLADRFKSLYKKDLINKAQQGYNSQTLIDGLPSIFKWKEGETVPVITDCTTIKNITEVDPPITIETSVITEGVKKYAEQEAKKVAEDILKNAGIEATPTVTIL